MSTKWIGNQCSNPLSNWLLIPIKFIITSDFREKRFYTTIAHLVSSLSNSTTAFPSCKHFTYCGWSGAHPKWQQIAGLRGSEKFMTETEIEKCYGRETSHRDKWQSAAFNIRKRVKRGEIIQNTEADNGKETRWGEKKKKRVLRYRETLIGKSSACIWLTFGEIILMFT